MFETSRPNAAAIALYRAAVGRPVANSLSTDLYALIPNSTDVTVFAERPWTILNFAVIGNETRYHSAGDDLAALDRRSLQHMGEQTIEVTARYATGEVPAADGTRLYTDLAGQVLIVLPLLFELVLLGLLILFFVIEATRRRALGRPLLGMMVALIGATGLAFAGHALVQLLRAGDFWRAYPSVTTTAVYASALLACVIGLAWVAGTAERPRLRAAFWLIFLLVGAAICFVAPGAAIYFLLPPLVTALGMVAKRWWASAAQAGAILAIVLLFVTFGPALALFEDLLNGGPLWVFAPLGATILLPALIELRLLLTAARPIALAGALGVLGWAGAAFVPAYSTDRQQLFTIEYVWDETAHTGRFAVNNDGAPVPFAGTWERAEFPYTARRRWAAAAPPVPVAAPTATIVGQQRTSEARRIRIRLTANGAEQIVLIAPRAANLRAAGGGGFLQRFGDNPERYFLRCAGRTCDGALLDLVLGTADPVEFTIIGTRSGLPPAAAELARARPANARPQYGADSTIAIGRLRL